MNYHPSHPLQDRVAIVTGGVGGIGLETIKALKENGATVVMSDINAAKGKEAAAELGTDFFAANVADTKEVRALAQYTLDRHGRIDIAFNNAGITTSVAAEECSDEDWLRIINVNLNAVFYCCREFGKAMLAQGKGSIINTASMSGIIANTPQPQAAYNVSKAGVIMCTKSLACEWAKRGVRVNCISPGYINTPMTPKDRVKSEWYEPWMQFTPMGRIGEAHEVAPAVVFLASDASSFFTGSNLVVDGGYTCY